jgi:RNA polymerase sigma-70 factor, ECF subfamily
MLNHAAAATAPGVHDTAKLYRDYAGKVSRWATRLTRSSSDADDLVQEVFLTAHRRLSSLDQIDHPGAWLFQMTRNVAQHLWRTRWRSAKRELSWESECQPSAPPSPFDELEGRRAARQIERALGSLDDRYRDIYRLCEIERLSSAKVAALMGLKPETVRVRRFRARRQIAEQLGCLGRASITEAKRAAA